MRSNTRFVLAACALVALLLGPQPLLAGAPKTDGEIKVKEDKPLKFRAEGSISISGTPRVPDKGAAAHTVVVDYGTDDDGNAKAPINWKFTKVTLHADGGLGEKDDKGNSYAKGVWLELNHDPKNYHLVAPHGGEQNELGRLETKKVDLKMDKLGNKGEGANLGSWDVRTHEEKEHKHSDWYRIRAHVKYKEHQNEATLESTDIKIRADHQEAQPGGWPTKEKMPEGPPPVIIRPPARYDAEQRLLSIGSSNQVAGVDADDPLAAATFQGLNLFFDGQDENGGWRFRNGHFALSSPPSDDDTADITIEGALGGLTFDPGSLPFEGSVLLSQGSVVDRSEGASPWINNFLAAMFDDVETGVDGTAFGSPAIWLRSEVNLAELTDGFTRSVDLIPLEMAFTLSLAELDDHDLPGDYNSDGIVDDRDYVVWKEDFGTIGSPAGSGHDGVVDAAGYTVWRDNLGATSELVARQQAGSSVLGRAAAIPEPSAAALVLIAMSALLVVRRGQALN